MFIKYNLFGIIWAFVILGLTTIPVPEMPDQEWMQLFSIDKLAHFGVFAIQTLLLIVGYHKQNRWSFLRAFPVLAAIGSTILYGLVIEIIQLTLPSRSFEWFDLVADAIGSGIGTGLFYLIYKL